MWIRRAGHGLLQLRRGGETEGRRPATGPPCLRRPAKPSPATALLAEILGEAGHSIFSKSPARDNHYRLKKKLCSSVHDGYTVAPTHILQLRSIEAFTWAAAATATHDLIWPLPPLERKLFTGRLLSQHMNRQLYHGPFERFVNTS